MPDDQYLLGLYDNLGGQAKIGSFEGFKTAMETSDEYRGGIYNMAHTKFGENIGSYQAFEELTKKKDGGNAIPPSPGEQDSSVPAPDIPSTTSTPQGITSMWGSDGTGKPSWLAPGLPPSSLLNTRQRSDFARENGYVLSPDKQKELASNIAQRPISDDQKEKDSLIDFLSNNTPSIIDREKNDQRRNLMKEGKIGFEGQPLVAGLDIDKEISDRTSNALKEKGIPNIEDARSFIDQALANKDYKTIREAVNGIYGYQNNTIKRKYDYTSVDDNEKKVSMPTEWASALKALSFGMWDGVNDQYDKDVAPLTQERNRLNMLLDAISSSDYAITNPKIIDDYNNDVAGGKPIKPTDINNPTPGTLTPSQYSGLSYFKDNNPEMYNKMSLELGKSSNPQLFGYKAYDTNNRDYQWMMYQLDKKGRELNGMAIDQRAQELAPQKKQVDLDFRTRISNIQQAIKAAPDYDQKKQLTEQLQGLQQEYASNPVIQEFGNLTNVAQSIDFNMQDKYPDFASQERVRMVKDILQNDLKGENIFTKMLNEFGERMKWLVGSTSDALGNMSGISELAVGDSRNYFRNLRRGELQQEEMYQPAASAAVEPLYKLNFNDHDYDVIKSIQYGDMEDKEKTKAIADYLDANKERIRYTENSTAGKQNWTFGAIGNQLADVGSQIIYQGALTYLTAGAGKALLGGEVAGAGMAADRLIATQGAEMVGASGLDGGAASLGAAVDIGAGLNETSLAIKDKVIHLGSIMGSTYATAYQPAYYQAIQDGKSEEEAKTYANEIAFVNALSETISPDIDVMKRSLGGAGGLGQIINEASLSRARKFGQATRAFAKGYLKNTGMETMEEIFAAYGEYGIDAMHNMNQDEMNTLQQRVQQATWSTMIGMAPWGASSGFSTIRVNNQLQRESFYQAGVHPEIMRGEINQLIQDGGINQEEGNRRIQMVNTMENIVQNLPQMNDGTEMTSEEKIQYAYNEAQLRAYKNQAKDAPEDSRKRKQLEAKQDELFIANDKILEGSLRPKNQQNNDNNNRDASGTESGSTATVPSGEATGNTGIETADTPAGNAETIAPTVQYAVGSTIETPDLGELKVISENNGVYTIEMPDGSHENFTGQEINNELKPVQRTPVEENAPNIAIEQQEAAVERQSPAKPAAVAEPAPAAERKLSPESQSVLDNITVSDYIKTNPALTDYGKQYAEKNPETTITEARSSAANAFEYLDGTIDASTYLERERYNLKAFKNEEEITDNANRKARYWSDLRQQAIENQNKTNEQSSPAEQASTAAPSTATETAQSQTNESPAVTESAVSQPLNTNENVKDEELPVGQIRESNAPITAGDGQVNTSNEGAGIRNDEVGRNRNQTSAESERVRPVRPDTGTEERISGGNEETGGRLTIEEESIDDTAGLSEEEQSAVGKMSMEELYNSILEADPENAVKGKANQYSKAELETIYKGAKAIQQADTQGEAQPSPAQQSAVGKAVTKLNDANNLVTKRKADLDAIKNKNSTDYQVKKKFHEAALEKQRAAEKEYIKALAAENSQLFRQKRGNMNSGIPFGKEDARIIANYVQMAKVYLNQGVRTLEDFANKIGEKVNEHMRRAWGVVTAEPAPVKQEGETYKQYLSRLREWERGQVSKSEQNNTPEVAENARAQAAELRLGVKKLKQGLDLLSANPSMGMQEFNEKLGLDETEMGTYVAALKEMIRTDNNKVTASSVLKNLRQNNPKMVTATEMSLLRRQLAYMERGSKLGYKAATADIKAIQQQVRDILNNLYDSGLLKSGTFTQKDLIDMGKAVSNIRNEEGMQNFSDFVQKVIDNSSVAATVQDIRNLQDRLGALLKSEAVTANRKRRSNILGTSVLRAMKNVNPLQIQEALRFNGMLSNVVNSLEGKEVLDISDDDVINYIDSQNQQLLKDRASQLKDRYTETLVIADENNTAMRVNDAVDQDEFNSMVDAIMNNRELSRDGKMNEIKALRNAVLAFERQVEEGSSNYVNLAEVYDEIKAVNNTPSSSKVKARLIPMIQVGKALLDSALQATDFNATQQQREWVQSMIDLGVENMNNKELSLFKNVIDNIFVNNDFSGAAAYDAQYKGQQRVQRLLDFFEKTKKKITGQAFDSKVGGFREAISSTDMVALAVANNDRGIATQLYDATGLGDLKSQHAQAKQVLEKTLIKPLKNLYKQYKKDGIRTYESNFKRSMYAYLSQNNLGNSDDVQKEFNRRKNLLMQDIVIKENSDEKTDIDEAAALKGVFDKYFQNINSYDELQNADILNEGERKVYDLFRDFYDNHKDSFREISESLLNRPFNDVNNYVKDSYKTLKTNISEGDLTNISASTFTPPVNINLASNASLQRNNFTSLNNIDVTDGTGRSIGKRVINHDFDNSQIFNSTSMMEDIYTLKTRMEAMEALEDKRFKEAIGTQNLKVLARNVENQVKSQMNLRKRGLNAGTAEVIAQDVANTVQKIGARQVLFATGQLLKQPADIIANTMINMGTDFPLFLKSLGSYSFFGNAENKADINRLFQQNEIGLRGHTFGGTHWLGAHAISEIQNTLQRVGKNAELNDEDKLSALIEKPDTWFAKVAWMSYYAQSLQKQGVVESYDKINWKDEADNINREARDYAQMMTSVRLNVNSKDSQSDLYARSSGGGSLLRVLLLPFSSFNMNNNALLATDIATLTHSGSKEQKLTALRSIGSRMVAELAFQATRAAFTGYVLKPAAYGILQAIGVPPPPKKDDDFWHKVISESAMNMFFGLFGNFSIDLVARGINAAIGDDEFIYRIKDNPNAHSNSIPGASILINPMQDNYDYIKEVFSNFTNKKGDVVASTPQEKTLLFMTAMYNLASNFGFAEADTRRVLNTASQVVVRNKQKERGDPYWRLMNNPKEQPKIKIHHKEIAWTEEQLRYYQEQKAYHIQQTKQVKSWTDEYRSRRATERAKLDLQNKFKGEIKFKE